MLNTNFSTRTNRRARIGTVVAGALLIGSLSPALASAVPIIAPTQPTAGTDSSAGSSTETSAEVPTTAPGVPGAADEGAKPEESASPTSSTAAQPDGSTTGGAEQATPQEYAAEPEDLAITGSSTQMMLAVLAGLGVAAVGLLVAARHYRAGA